MVASLRMDLCNGEGRYRSEQGMNNLASKRQSTVSKLCRLLLHEVTWRWWRRSSNRHSGTHRGDLKNENVAGRLLLGQTFQLYPQGKQRRLEDSAFMWASLTHITLTHIPSSLARSSHRQWWRGPSPANAREIHESFYSVLTRSLHLLSRLTTQAWLCYSPAWHDPYMARVFYMTRRGHGSST